MNELTLFTFTIAYYTTTSCANTYFQPIQKKYTSGQFINWCNNEGYMQVPQVCPPLAYPPVKSVVASPPPSNPLFDALILSKMLNLNTKLPGYNHLEHLPLNPFLALLLSHYGQYVPIYGKGRGLYGYTAANNYHNNKPFGAYKVYEDSDS